MRSISDSDLFLGYSMFKIGLTGGIGSGKTKISILLEKMGAAVIDADRIARSLTDSGGKALPIIQNVFGTTALSKNGSMNRSWIRQLIFLESAQRNKLEAILHPLIRSEIDAQIAKKPFFGYFVLVIPLLVESLFFWKTQVDRICVVDCDPETQILRVKMRNGLSEDMIRRIMAVQVLRSVRLKAADDVILNDGSTSLKELTNRIRKYHKYWYSLSRK